MYYIISLPRYIRYFKKDLRYGIPIYCEKCKLDLLRYYENNISAYIDAFDTFLLRAEIRIRKSLTELCKPFKILLAQLR